MSQVIRNIISNALKFTSYGGTIVVACEAVNKACSASNHKTASTVPTSEWLRISVFDDGVGIAPENIGKLFKGIIQFDANKLQGGKGTGLGMFISSGIVDLHGGTIAVTSEGLGRGCTFSVELPLIRTHMSSKNIGARQASCGDIKPECSSTVDDMSEFSRSRVDSSASPYHFVHSHKLPLDEECGCIGTVQDSSPRAVDEIFNIATVRQTASVSYNLDDTPADDHTVKMGNHTRLPSASKWESSRPRRNAQEILRDVESGKILVPQLGALHTPSQFSTIDLRDCRVLIVDDSPMNLKMMSLMIKKFGADCIDAADGEQAVELVTNSLNYTGRHIDIVIMDNNMDVMNGPQACWLMREAGFMNPIFGLTGDTDESCDKEYLAAGANRILRKPLKLQEIIDALTLCSL
jgi:CheY-like chemotaxis protein